MGLKRDMSDTNGIGRLDFILGKIEEWKRRDPELEDKQGFLKFIDPSDPGKYGVKNTKIWLKYHKEARQKRITVKELLFDRMNEIQKTIISEPTEKPIKDIIDVVTEDEAEKIKEIYSRLRKDEETRRAVKRER